jgi:hypothetical protein
LVIEATLLVVRGLIDPREFGLCQHSQREALARLHGIVVATHAER